MNRKLSIFIHICVWAIIFLSPLTYVNRGNGVKLLEFAFLSAVQVPIMLVFYANYLWLVPKYLANGKGRCFWIVNVVMIVVLALISHYWMDVTHHLLDPAPQRGEPPMNWQRVVMTTSFVFRNMFNLAISAAIATLIQLAMRWQASEAARKAAEAARTAAELKNLRQQINPHFLLNTLNNIYALVAFNKEKAQVAIQELSKLLRHVLYDNQQEFVSLDSEVQLLTNYTNLMKIRLGANVDVRMDVNTPQPCTIMISPLIFISLVENAFKHGVSPTQPSYIYIKVEADEQKITCRIENSNFPKAQTDRSGHGIGLRQVAERLELMYHGKYEWTKQVSNDNKTYTSTITIYDPKLCNN